MAILIHACCADCLLKLLHALRPEDFVDNKEAVIIFYNPNIYPREEYQSRLKAVKKVAFEEQIKLIVPNYKPKDYFTAVIQNWPSSSDDSRVNIPSKETRCPKCWSLRLSFVFAYAKEHGFDLLTSTLLSSTYQDQKKIKKIAQDLSKKFGVDFYQPKEIDCCLKTTGFYKQNFCGCLFSLIEKSREKYEI